MIALIQRVSSAAVEADGEPLARIGTGLVAFVAVERGDGEDEAERLAERVLAYRVFPDAAGRMNRSLREVGGALLAVPQFTLAADTASGLRPSFTPAAPPEQGCRLFDCFVARARAGAVEVASGRFGATMRVRLVNEGPATFWLRVPPA